MAWAKLKVGDARAASNMRNFGLIDHEIYRTSMGFPFAASPEEEFAAITPEEVRADVKQCLVSRPTFSIVGDEPTVRAALADGWK